MMTKVLIGILVALTLAAICGFAFGVESWSDEQAWVMLGVVAAVVVVWSLSVWINRNESRPKR